MVELVVGCEMSGCSASARTTLDMDGYIGRNAPADLVIDGGATLPAGFAIDDAGRILCEQHGPDATARRREHEEAM
jgi:hypothetical protein